MVPRGCRAWIAFSANCTPRNIRLLMRLLGHNVCDSARRQGGSGSQPVTFKARLTAARTQAASWLIVIYYDEHLLRLAATLPLPVPPQLSGRRAGSSIKRRGPEKVIQRPKTE